jgi:hypothetical protein
MSEWESRRRPVPALAGLLLVGGLAVGGCAALAPAAVGTAAIGAGAGSLVKAGTEYTLGGAAYRTFSAPLDEVYDGVRRTFEDLQMTITRERFTGGKVRIQGVATHRTFTVVLDPVTPALTRLKLVVREMGGLGKDRATAAEIIAQAERRIPPYPAAGIDPR